MNLYAVRLTLDVVIYASDEERARELAKNTDMHRDEKRFLQADNVKRVTTEADLPTGWDRGSLPYGRQDDVTIGEIIGGAA